MSKFDKVAYYYCNGLWSLARVQSAVEKRWISKAEYEMITGKSFPENRGNY